MYLDHVLFVVACLCFFFNLFLGEGDRCRLIVLVVLVICENTTVPFSITTSVALPHRGFYSKIKTGSFNRELHSFIVITNIIRYYRIIQVSTNIQLVTEQHIHGVVLSFVGYCFLNLNS